MIVHPLILTGEKVKLVPLHTSQFEELIRESHDPKIWTYMPVDGTRSDILRDALNTALEEREKGIEYPFAVIELETGKIIGSTRFLRINSEHRNLEIGWTWYLPEFWGKGYNEECKYLLLKHCFEVLDLKRVQIVTWDQNLRSRKAVERIGGKFEGTLRNFVIRRGIVRSTAVYSIIDEEWPEIKVRLAELFKSRYSKNSGITS